MLEVIITFTDFLQYFNQKSVYRIYTYFWTMSRNNTDNSQPYIFKIKLIWLVEKT